MRLMLLVMLLFGAAPQIIALPPKVAMAFACVDEVCFLPSALNVNVKMFKKCGETAGIARALLKSEQG